MSRAQHTPGIWRVAGYVDEDERDGAVAVVAHDGFIVAEVLKWPQQDANARLIAAAPEMYEALKLVMQHGRIDDSEHRMNLVAAAIAKAEGRHD